MNDNPTIKEKMQSSLTRWGIFGVILLVVFLLGFVPMWMQKRTVVDELAATQNQLRKSEIRGLLTTAIVESHRGEYEPARQDASEFFTRLRAEIDKGDSSALTKEERDKLGATFANRDATITMLAQRDQASVQRLTDIYENYRQAVKQPLTAAPSVSPAAISPAASPGSPPTQPTPATQSNQ
ncbi:MAG: hypothetical protein ACR2LT_00220 [Pyrinomonadaceae bacterium]